MKNIHIEGSSCRTKLTMFETFSEAFQFPDYFAQNWDSFDEIMCDLSWIEEDEITLLITQFNEFLRDAEEEDKDIFFNIISNVEEYSGKVFLLELRDQE